MTSEIVSNSEITKFTFLAADAMAAPAYSTRAASESSLKKNKKVNQLTTTFA